MKLLFDQNLSFKLCGQLADLFPGSTQVRMLGLDTADDLVIFAHARDQGFMIVTQDGDFADLSTLFGSPPKIVWLRHGNAPTREVERLLRDRSEALAVFVADVDLGCIELY